MLVKIIQQRVEVSHREVQEVEGANHVQDLVEQMQEEMMVLRELSKKDNRVHKDMSVSDAWSISSICLRCVRSWSLLVVFIAELMCPSRVCSAFIKSFNLYTFAIRALNWSNSYRNLSIGTFCFCSKRAIIVPTSLNIE